MEAQPRFALVAGESSGDLLGENLIRALTERYPGARFAGIGGPRMAAAGMDCWFEARELAVMGLAEVIRHLPRLLRVRRQVRQQIVNWKPTAFVGIDAPDFNLGLERRLRGQGIKALHYVSPSVWAWRSGRVDKIGRCADAILTLFPFEPAIYQQRGIPAHFVGHPLADAFPEQPDPLAYRRELGLPEGGRLVAVLPGSRQGEVERIGPIFAQTLSRLPTDNLSFVAPAATEETGRLFRAQVAQWATDVSVHWLQGRSREAMLAADAVLLASGTAALEAMLAKRPMVVGYCIAPLTYWIVNTLGLMEIDHYSLPNVLAGKPTVPEMLQAQMTPDNLATALAPLLEDSTARQQQTGHFLELHRRLKAAPGALVEAITRVIEGEH